MTPAMAIQLGLLLCLQWVFKVEESFFFLQIIGFLVSCFQPDGSFYVYAETRMFESTALAL